MGRYGSFNTGFFYHSVSECVCMLLVAALLVTVLRISWRYREANRMYTRYPEGRPPEPPPPHHRFCTRWFCYDRRTQTTCTRGE